MPTLTIDDETSELAQQLARRTGKTAPEAVKAALQETLRAAPVPAGRQLSPEERQKRLLEIARRAASRPVFDTRSADDILGYDEKGFW